MQFDPRAMLVTESSTAEMKRLDEISTTSSRSFVNEAIDFITECDSIMDNTTRLFYKSILEADSDDVLAITESFEDFKNGVVEIIDKFLKFIKSLFDRFINALHSLVKSDKYIKKNKELLREFNSNHDFTFKGYNYTFKPTVPSLNKVKELADFTDEINLNAQSLSSFDFSAAYNNLYDGLEDWYDEARRDIIQDDAPVYESNWAERLFEIYRDNDSAKIEIEVNSTYINMAYIRFDNYHKAIKEVNQVKKRIEKEYGEIKSKLERSTKRDVSNKDLILKYNPAGDATAAGNLSISGKDNVLNMEMIMKLQQEKVQKLSDMHSMAFSYKLDAMKDCFNQDKAILYKALDKLKTKHLVGESVVVIGGPECNHRHVDSCDVLSSCEDDDFDFDFDLDEFDKDLEEFDSDFYIDPPDGEDDDYDDDVIHDNEGDE